MCVFLDVSIRLVKYQGDTRITRLLGVNPRGPTGCSGFVLEGSLVHRLVLMVLRGANVLERFLMDCISH